MLVIKRNGDVADWDSSKVERAVNLSMSRTSEGTQEEFAKFVAESVYDKLSINTEQTVERIHKEVENFLMFSNKFDAAREYITYRNNHKPSIFRKRVAIKPYEYPQLLEYVDAIRHSYWVHTEFNYGADVQDIQINFKASEKQAVLRSMLAVSQIENQVKTFWGNIHNRMPKPEIAKVGATFSECHVAGTEILTPQGWLDFRVVNLDTDVMQYDKYTGQMTITKPSNIVNEQYTGEVYKLENSVTSAILTPNHRMIFTNKKSGQVLEKCIKDISSFHSEMMLPATGELVGTESLLSAVDKIRIAIQADGSTRYWRNKGGVRISRGLTKGCQTYEISFKKDRKKVRFKQLLNDSGLQYREFILGREDYIKYELDMPLDYDLKTLDWVDLSDKSSTWCREFVEELAEWDGHRLDGKGNAKNCLIKYSTTNKQCADVVQAVGVCAGYKCHINTYTDERKDSFSDVYTVSFTKANLNSSMTLTPKSEQYDGTIHCVTVPTGVIITRHNDRVLISGNSEVRHEDAYSNLIEVLGLNSEFDNITKVPAMKKRIKYLEQAMANVNAEDNEDFYETIMLFSTFIENVSLFSQFLIIMSFEKHKQSLKNMSQVISSTSKEETIHAMFGFDLINIIKKENPRWWNKEVEDSIIQKVHEAYEAECEVLDWILEAGDLEFMSKEVVQEFIKDRLNQSLVAIGLYEVFTIKQELLKQTEWFNDEVTMTKRLDNFTKRGNTYSKKQKSITSEDLF